jgi:hypothetical protein
MFTLREIFTLLLAHGLCDYLLQTDWQATNKSKEWKPLLSHTATYTTTMTLIVCMMFLHIPIWSIDFCGKIILFGIITFITHTITDYFTSRLNSKLWAAQKRHAFFCALEGDQLLHYIQLFTTYWWLFK